MPGIGPSDKVHRSKAECLHEYNYVFGMRGDAERRTVFAPGSEAEIALGVTDAAVAGRQGVVMSLPGSEVTERAGKGAWVWVSVPM
jgi:hypothetical protein